MRQCAKARYFDDVVCAVKQWCSACQTHGRALRAYESAECPCPVCDDARAGFRIGDKTKESQLPVRQLAFLAGGATRIRTGDTRIFSPMLYQLSYGTLRWSGVFRCFAVQSYNLFRYCANIFRIIFCCRCFVCCISGSCGRVWCVVIAVSCGCEVAVRHIDTCATLDNGAYSLRIVATRCGCRRLWKCPILSTKITVVDKMACFYPLRILFRALRPSIGLCIARFLETEAGVLFGLS